MQINTQEEAVHFIDTEIRQQLIKTYRALAEEASGEAKQGLLESADYIASNTPVKIQKEDQINGHNAWSYVIEGQIMTLDGRQFWLIDTGETVETTMNEGERTIGEAYQLKYDKPFGDDSGSTLSEEKALDKAKVLLLRTDPNYTGTFGIKKVDEIGYLVWQEVRGGGSIVVGNDGGVLFSNMTGTISPEDLINAYKEGKRSDENKFGGVNSSISEDQVKEFVQNKFNEVDGSDRIEDRGFAFYIDTQPREYLDTKNDSKMTIGNGPIVVLKNTGEVFSFSSNPLHMFGKSESRVGVNTAKTVEEFQAALDDLKAAGDHAALHPEKLGNEV